MQRLEVSGAVRPLQKSLGIKGLMPRRPANRSSIPSWCKTLYSLQCLYRLWRLPSILANSNQRLFRWKNGDRSMKLASHLLFFTVPIRRRVGVVSIPVLYSGTLEFKPPSEDRFRLLRNFPAFSLSPSTKTQEYLISGQDRYIQQPF